jgi:glycine/D-amino acid oxidase-like deaminating enzyme
MPTRRQFVSAGLVGLTAKAGKPVAGGFVNDAFPTGHRLRDRQPFQAPKSQKKVALAIVGGGMAGLCAAYRLNKRGFRDFVVLEMEAQAGGNSRWGENAVSAYPWAAHYVPAPNRGSKLVRELFEELGLIRDGQLEERHLCHSPQERLFLHGRWQEGIEPRLAATKADVEQYRRFEERIGEFRASGRFTIPLEDGLRPSSLESISMDEWMRRNRFDSPYLRWYVDYACRDDYGAAAAETSAWAGIHYHASREHEEKGPFTWPEGNGWLTRRLLERIGEYVRAGSPVYGIAREGSRWKVFTEQAAYLAGGVIFAAPTFLAHSLIEGVPRAEGFVYSPWLTANLTLDRLPAERGAPLAWDNVIYNSPSLGYVVATHQSVASRIERSVWTYYWALAHKAPAEARKDLLEKDWSYWKEAILADLSRAHPDIRECVSRIDIMRMGHAMIRPSPGFLFSAGRARFTAARRDRLWFANSDLSGISIFEEAQYRGDRAALEALRVLG